MVKIQKKIWLIIAGMVSAGVLCPIVLEYFIFRNDFYSVIENKDWASFLGSFIGGIIGGIGTLVAVYITVTETREIQKETNDKIEEDRKALKLKENKVFTDEIITIIAKYITDINRYFYCGRTYTSLQNELQCLKDKLSKEETEKSKKLKKKKEFNIDNNLDEIVKIEFEIEELNNTIHKISDQIRNKVDESEKNYVNRTIAVECYYLLNIKLEGIDIATKLIEKLKNIHKLSVHQQGDVNIKTFDTEIEVLQKITKEFIDKYITL